MRIHGEKWKARETAEFVNELCGVGLRDPAAAVSARGVSLTPGRRLSVQQGRDGVLGLDKLTALCSDGFPVGLTQTRGHGCPRTGLCPLMAPLLSVKHHECHFFLPSLPSFHFPSQ